MEQTLPPQQGRYTQQGFGYNSGIQGQRQKIFQDSRSTYQPQPVQRTSLTPTRGQIQDKQHWDNQLSQKNFNDMKNQEIRSPNLQERSKSYVPVNASQQNMSYVQVQQQNSYVQQQQSQNILIDNNMQQQQILYQEPEYYEERVKKAANPKNSYAPDGNASQGGRYIISEGIDQQQVQIAQIPNKTSYQMEQFKDMEIYVFHYNNQQGEDSYDVAKLVKQSEGVSACNIF